MKTFLQSRKVLAIVYVLLGLIGAGAASVYASTITTINGSDTLTASRAVINTNFSNLNTDKLEAGSTAATLKITNASTTIFGCLGPCYFGATATTSASSAGIFTFASGGAHTLPYASSTALTVSGTGYFGTASTTNLTISGLTANRIPYITTNGVVTSSGNLTFDGTKLTTVDGQLTSATTTNLGINSETFTDLTGFGLANTAGQLGITTSGAADEECATYESTGPTLEWQSCAAGAIGGTGTANLLAYFTDATTVAATSSPTMGWFVSTSTSVASIFPYASTTALTISGTGFAGAFQPTSNDSGALGVSGTAWSDLFLASGAVINFNAGDITITHSANDLAFAGGTTTVSNLHVTTAFNFLGDYITTVATWFDTKIEALTNVVLQGVWDFGGATSVEIPNGTGPTVDAVGEIALDTTANCLVAATSTDATVPAVFCGKDSLKFEISTSTLDYKGAFGASGTTTIKVAGYDWPILFTAARCRTNSSGNGTTTIRVGDGTNWTSYFLADDRSGGIKTSLGSNNSFTAGEDIHIEIGSLSGTVSDSISCDLPYLFTRE